MHPVELKWADLQRVGPFHVRGRSVRLALEDVHDLRTDAPEGVVLLAARSWSLDAAEVPEVSGRCVVVDQSPVIETVKVVDGDWFVVETHARESLRQARFPVVCSAAYLDEVARVVAADCTPAEFLDALCKLADTIGELAPAAGKT